MTLNVGMVTIDCENPQRLAQFWSQALALTVLGDYGDYVLLGREDSPISLGLQKVPEPRVGKNRVHLDLRGEQRSAAIDRLTALGATVKNEHRIQGRSERVM